MSKKIAEGTDALVLDVKFGSGAFMQDIDRARELARTMVALGTDAGVATTALLTDMNVPLGLAIGNANEVRESVEVLAGGGPADVVELTVALAREMLALAGQPDADVEAALDDGRAMDTWRRDDPRAGRRPGCRAARRRARRTSSRRPPTASSTRRTRCRSASPPGASAPVARAREDPVHPRRGHRPARRSRATRRRRSAAVHAARPTTRRASSARSRRSRARGRSATQAPAAGPARARAHHGLSRGIRSDPLTDRASDSPRLRRPPCRSISTATPRSRASRSAACRRSSLHDHLDGGAAPADDHRARRRDRPRRCPRPTPTRSRHWFAEQSDSGSLVEYLKTFDLTIAVMQTARGPHPRRARVRPGPRRRRRDLRRGALGARAAPRRAGSSLDEAVEAVQDGHRGGRGRRRAARAATSASAS